MPESSDRFIRLKKSILLRRTSQWMRLSELSLRGRIVLYILSSSLIIFAGVASVSWYAISSLQVNKLQKGIQSNLRQIVLSLENSLSILNHVSQQLSYDGPVGKKFEQYLGTRSCDLSIHPEILHHRDHPGLGEGLTHCGERRK